MCRRFNIRVYGIWINDGKVLVNEEMVRDKSIIKFPGGGLDWGEGIIDCLKREWKEELDIDIDVLNHFYTTDFFQASAYDESQVISIYYTVTADSGNDIKNKIANERTYWVSFSEITGNTFTLPIDKVVGNMLQSLYNSQIGV